MFCSKGMVVPHRYEILKTIIKTRQENIVEAKEVQFIVNVEDIDIFHVLEEFVINSGGSRGGPRGPGPPLSSQFASPRECV